MKKIVSSFLILLMIVGLCSCAQNYPSPEDPSAEEQNTDASVTEDLVRVQLPKDIAGDVSEENLPGFIEYYGLETAELNSDGSVTAVFTRDRWITTVALIRKQIDEQLSLIVRSSDYPNISETEVNEMYDEYTIHTDSEELTENEKILCSLLGGYAYYHYIYYKMPELKFTIDFINNTSGECIMSYTQEDWNYLGA